MSLLSPMSVAPTETCWVVDCLEKVSRWGTWTELCYHLHPACLNHWHHHSVDSEGVHSEGQKRGHSSNASGLLGVVSKAYQVLSACQRDLISC